MKAYNQQRKRQWEDFEYDDALEHDTNRVNTIKSMTAE